MTIKDSDLKKLSWKHIDLYTIKQNIETQVYHLDLSQALKLHNVFQFPYMIISEVRLYILIFALWSTSTIAVV